MDDKRVLGIDVGIWNLSFCDVSRIEGEVYTVHDWKNVSIPELAGFPNARSRARAADLTHTFLCDCVLAALHAMFPAETLRHTYDVVLIESQPHVGNKSNKISELGAVIYSYFMQCVQPHALCCWRMPVVRMQSAGSKFDDGPFFSKCPSDILEKKLQRKAKMTYVQRKAYGVSLVRCLLVNSHVRTLPEHAESFHGARKADDLADSMLLAAIALR